MPDIILAKVLKITGAGDVFTIAAYMRDEDEIVKFKLKIKDILVPELNPGPAGRKQESLDSEVKAAH